MICRRHALFLALAALPPTSLLLPSAAHAQQAFQRFIPFLVDLDGWQGKKADGVALQTPGSSLVTATREYQRGAARFHAQVITGPAAQGALAATRTGVNIETADGRVSSSTVDGLPVTRTFNNKDKSGAILVALGTSAMFSVSFNGLAEDEALTLARKFNWKAIQAATQK